MQHSYQPIENYGVIGNLNTVSLVSLDGSIDFLCFPDFDSPTVFASILDKSKGGYFRISPAENDVRHKQLYLPDTNVLLTRFLARAGVGEITDFMPLGGQELIRIVDCARGSLSFRMECCPRFDYARATHTVDVISEKEFVFRNTNSHSLKLRLRATVPMELKDGNIVANFALKIGERATFVLDNLSDDTVTEETLQHVANQRLYHTIDYWKDWVSKSKYNGRWMEVVNRSALMLKLLTSDKYGSTVAAATFGLPEDIGGVRNWDYRYTWIRDASFTVYALLKLGYKKEAKQFTAWIEWQCKDIAKGENLRLMYGIDGRKDLVETTLDHLEGYKGSRPVRIGNDAFNQVQLDIYGELLDAVYLTDRYAEPISYDFWRTITYLVDWVCVNWTLKDEGIWEVRGGKKHFLYSRMMCWVAMDRGIKIAEAHSFPLNQEWRVQRDKIFLSIHEEFWNEDLQTFVQYKGADTVDAATLLMPLIRFISPTDPKWLSTLKRIEDELVSDSLVYRYRINESLDGLKGGEGTFSMCTFWYVECLSKAGLLNKARLCFEKMLGYANHVGLYAEQVGKQGEHLGNFPQAFTHLGLITAALNLDHQFSDKRNKGIEESPDV